MSCLLPQFKCQPDTFSIHFKPQYHHHLIINNPHLSKNREPGPIKAQCILSTTSTSTSIAVLDLEKLRLPSLEAHSDPVAASGLWTPKESAFGATLAMKTLITDDEAVIAAAAAEAIALARAAHKAAKEAALIFENLSSSKTESNLAPSSSAEVSSRWYQFTEAELAGIIGDSDTVGNGTNLREEHSAPDPIVESDNVELTDEELTVLEEQLSENIAVRSRQKPERKSRRMKAAEKSAATIVSIRSSSTSKKKRALTQDLDHSDPLRFLQGTTSSSRLLTANEELTLSAGIQDLLKLESLHDQLAERCGGQPTFAQWAAAAGVDQKTLRKRLNNGIHCKDKMIKSNIRLVISVAKNYQGAGMNLQDLVQEGCRGLIRGAEKFDASKGFKFSTYGHWWIKQAVRKSLSDQSRTIRLPFHMVEATYRVKEARRQLYSKNGRHANDEEVAEATGLSMKRLSTVMLTPKAPRSLDQKIGINMDLKPSEVIADPDAETLEDTLMKQFMRQDLEKVLDSLNPRENQVIRWRFGLEGGRMKTLQEIGELMGVSRERIRQIESSAFRKLKNKKRTKQLSQYLVA